MIDETGLPVIGATVMVPNTSTGVVTGIDGDFKLKVKKGTKLRFSYTGYKTLELLAQKDMRVKLKPDQKMLDDVVVVGYMPRKVANTSASVIKLKGGELANKPVANPLDAIQGKISGLKIASVSGEPSAELEVQLHGRGSISGNPEPLVIIDGMPSNLRNVRAMNPNDIEDIQFLKDAAATSIYGSRAANGVMYITTKRGSSENGADIKVRSQYGISTLANTSYFDQLMTADELLRYYRQTGIQSKQMIDFLQDKIWKGHDFTWYKYIYQPASMYTTDISISGGSPTMNYYVSGGMLNQDGLKAGSNYRKFFSRINLNIKANDYIRFGLNTAVSYDKTKVSPFRGDDRSAGGVAVLNSPFVSPYDAETGKEKEVFKIGKLNVFSPSHYIDTHPESRDSFIATGNLNTTITPFKNFSIRSLVGLEMDYNNAEAAELPNFKGGNGEGSASKSAGRAIVFNATNTASYMFDIEQHSITALLGQEYVRTYSSSLTGSGAGLRNDRLLMLNHLTKEKNISDAILDYATLSYFSQLSYGYKDRYFLDLTMRNDLSSRFNSKKQSGIFWSAGLLWKAKKESFLRDVSWLNDLDFKASFGTQGMQSVDLSQKDSYVGRNGQKKGDLGLAIVSFGNQDLTWETQEKLTIGAKARLWNRLSVNLEYYRRVTKDMVLDVPVSLSKGFGSQAENTGRYLNEGIDLQMNFDILREKKYALAAYFNITYNQDRFLKLYDGKNFHIQGASLYKVGEPMKIFLPIYKGVNPDTGKPEWYKAGHDFTETRKDNADLSTEFSDQLAQNTGINFLTPVTGGWGLSGRWLNFYGSADFSFALGQHTISYDKQEFEEHRKIKDDNLNINGSRNLFNYWKEVGDKAEFPSLAYINDKSGNHHSTEADSKLIENSSFMRMKSLTIGYRIPQKTLKSLKVFKSAKIYFTGRNLLTFTKFRGSDPEIPNPSIGANPNTKQFSFGVDVGF